MIIIIICALIGIIAGVLFPYHIPYDYSRYAAMIILALLDSVFGAASAATRKSFDLRTFITGFISNSLLAALLTFMGDKLGIDLYLVALLVFGSRLFTNLSTMRRHFLAQISIKFKKKSCN